MKHTVIAVQLDCYRHARGNPHHLQRVTQLFLSSINPRLLRTHGTRAREAVCTVLKEVRVNPASASRALQALLQLCRDDPLEFSDMHDERLIESIAWEAYFSPLSLARLFVETQDGVV